MRVGFVGLGNVGGKLAGSLLRNGVALTVLDLDPEAVTRFTDAGASSASSPADLAASADVVITCLPSPAASATVMESDDGVLAGLRPGSIWMEMSTTDAAEIRRLAARAAEHGGAAVDCPVSGGCHRAATGNISIFAGCDRATFERVLPLLTILGRQVMHVGEVGTASILKVMTNYLATANLVSVCEALATMDAVGVDLATTYEAIRISSGNSFVHETESQLILNGSRDIGFTMDLVSKDIGLFQELADRHDVALDLNPLLVRLFADAAGTYGSRAQSDDIIRRWEDASGRSITAPGFPAELVDDEPEARGAEVRR
ncbi:MAG: NAD(P)-dependent oxidoreductase [Actinomycetota bacterium]